jgi:hypothetical protein
VRRWFCRYSWVVPSRRPWTRGARAPWLGPVIAALGCTEPPAPAHVLPCDVPLCVADPVPHLVCLDACERHDDCPLGTVCGAVAGHAEPVCTPPRGPQASSAALVEGFGVPPMEASLATVELPTTDGRVDATAELSWRAPSSTTVVTCVLLACPPSIEGGVITRYDQCVMARSVSAQPVGSWSLADAEREQPLPGAATCVDGSAPVASTDGRFPVTELVVGCWAYDDTGIVAATRLRRPAVSQIHDFHDSFDLDCQGAAAEGRTCVLGDGTMGSCAQGACHRRCLRDADCSEEGLPAEDGACDPDVRVGIVSLCVDPGPTRPVEDI